MSVTIPIQALELAPGSQITIPNLSWLDFDRLLEDLEEKRKTDVAYYLRSQEIMSLLALHERSRRITAYIITTIIEFQGRNWEDFGSTTFKRKDIAGVELDTCFLRRRLC